MKVKLNQAVKVFFGNSSLEMLYFEAIANALDANASKINIDIKIDSKDNLKTLSITIEDNGVGFTDERYKKFSNLFDVEEASHKGLGRLIYIAYFQDIQIESYYDKKKRVFSFSDDFDETNQNIETIINHNSGTKIVMKDYQLQKIAKYDYIDPKYLKKRILEEFYSLLFKKKTNKEKLEINIKANIEKQIIEEKLSLDDVLELKSIEIDTQIDLVNKLHIYYAINKIDDIGKGHLISAISIDNRTVKYDIIAKEYIPVGYEMVFLLVSDYFIGKIDLTRQNINIPPQEEKRLKEIFRAKVSQLIEKNIKEIATRNKNIKTSLIDKYPHLSSYFKSDEIGFVTKDKILENAQNSFFKEQKELLEASSLDNEQFEKALSISSKALTEYILFRQVTINNLKKINKNNSEAELHKLFATMKTDFKQDNKIDDIYKNNAWILDDKYMTYKTVFSDKEMDKIIKEITSDDEVEKDSDRPDIALVFSANPKEEKPFDVVIVEIKKRGIKLEENLKVISQLKKRARKLMHYFDNKIQRIWFYGIVEIDKEVELDLAGEYIELYSSGKMYYKPTEVAISLNPKKTLPIDVFIWDIDAIIDDAEARNSTFLELIKSKFIS